MEELQKAYQATQKKETERALIAEYFDSEYYLEVNNDVREKGADPLHHYLDGGGREEHRIPNRWFAPGFYLDKNPGLKKAGVEPFLHYLLHGWKEKRLPNPYVDASLYEKAGTLEEIAGYLTKGRMELLKEREKNEMGYLAPVRSLEGEVYAKGWAVSGTDAKATVEIWVNGSLYSTVSADLYDASLEESGMGDGTYGFNVRLPKALLKEKENMIEARSQFTGEQFINSPQTYPTAV